MHWRSVVVVRYNARTSGRVNQPPHLRSSAVSLLKPATLVAMLLVAWHVAVKFQKAPILPGPLAVGSALLELGDRGLLLKYVVASLFRVTWGFLGAALLAIPIGLSIGWYRRAELALNPLIQMLRPISPLAWIPISILWFGVGDLAAIFLIFLASFLPLTVTAMNAVAIIPEVYVNVGRNFGLRRAQLVYRVLYPAGDAAADHRPSDHAGHRVAGRGGRGNDRRQLRPRAS